MPRTKALRIDKLTVLPDRIVAVVSVNPSYSYTNPELAKRVLAVRPNLAFHACVNEKGPTFSAVMSRTPLPHLFEHIVVDILSQSNGSFEHMGDSAADGIVVGTSEWTDRKAGEARVEISYEDDLVGLAAFKEAEEFLNNMTA